MPVGQVRDAHGGVGRVDRLSAGARGAEDVDADVTLGDLDLDGLLHHRDDLDRGEARLALVGRAEGADAGETMRSRLDRQRAVRIGSRDLERRRLDACAFGVGRVHDLHGVLVTLGPAQVHAHEHLGEVGGVVAAGAGADRDDRRPIVVLAVEERLHLELTHDVFELGELAARLVGGILVVHLDGELDEHVQVVEALLDVVDALELGLPVAQRARDLLRLVDVVPEVGSARLLAQPGDVGGESLDVHDGLDVGEGGTERFDVGG